MKLIDLFRLSWSNLWGNKLRTLLTVLGVSIGIGAIVFLYSLGTGLQSLTIHRITQSEALTSLDVSVGSSAILSLNKDVVETFRKIDNVETVSPLISVSGQVSKNDITTDILVSGVEPVYSSLQALTISQGSFLPEVATSKPAVVLTSSVANLIGLSTKEQRSQLLGKSLSLTLFIPQGNGNIDQVTKVSRDYVVSGIVDNDTESIAYIPLSELTGLGITTYNSVKVKVKDLSQLTTVKRHLIDAGYTVNTIADLIDQINRVFKIVQYVLAGFGVIALSVASIGMFNTMTIALLERTRDIGIMRALGARSKDIQHVFLTESIVISITGGLVGIGLAFLLGTTVTAGLTLLSEKAGGHSLQLFIYPPKFLLLVMAFSLFVGFSTGIYPAIRAARLNPLQALRYE